jgi:hypothetical protein
MSTRILASRKLIGNRGHWEVFDKRTQMAYIGAEKT